MRALTRADRLACAVLALLMLFLFREALAGGVLFRRDIHQIWIPQVEGFVHAVAGGSLPLWDPSPAFGQPLLADPSAQILYPPTWLNLLLRPWVYYTVFAIGHLGLAGLGFLALGRRLGLSPLAAAAGAAVFTASGPLLSLVDLWHHFASASYLPLVFLAAESALATASVRAWLRLVLVLGLQILAGSADVCAMTIASLVVWTAIVHLQRSPRRLLAIAGFGGLAVALALVVGAGVWVAALDVVSRSARHALPEWVRTYWSVHPLGMLETLFAGVPGRLALSERWRQAIYDGREPFLASLYLGLPCLAFVGAAFSSGADRRRWALLTLGLGAGLLALGRHASFYEVAASVVPPVRVLRYPVKAMVVVAFAWAGLVGFGVDAWRARVPSTLGGSRRRWALLVAAPVALASLCAAAPLMLAGQRMDVLQPLARGLAIHAGLGAAVLLLALLPAGRRATAIPALAVAVAVLDLLVAHPRASPVAPADLYRHRPELLAAFGDPATARVYAYDYSDRARASDVPLPAQAQRLGRMPSGWSGEAALALAQQLSLAPQTAGRWRLRQAFDVDYRGLQSEPLAYLTRLVRLREQDPETLVRILRLGAVTHVIAQHRIGADRLRLVAEVPGLFTVPSLVLAVPNPLPRARVVAGVRVADGIPALAALLLPDFDPEREVLLPAGTPVAPPHELRGSARIVEERADRLRIAAELDRGGYLVVSDSYDPGWRVRVDGRDATLLRANVAFRAVALAAGRHEVEMVYRPPIVLAASLVSLASLAVLVLLLASRLGRPGARRDAARVSEPVARP